MADTYLYIDRQSGLDQLPVDLLSTFGEPEEVLTFRLTPDRKLAIVAAEDVLSAIDAQGFFLQLPPPSGEQ